MYRDDDATLHARIAQLEEEVEQARGRLEALRSNPAYQSARRRREAFDEQREDHERAQRRLKWLFKVGLGLNALGLGLLGCVVVFLVVRSWLV
ncbi:MAG: hypothetical protein RIF41_03890 [Polyangiaceae bacterium]